MSYKVVNHAIILDDAFVVRQVVEQIRHRILSGQLRGRPVAVRCWRRACGSIEHDWRGLSRAGPNRFWFEKWAGGSFVFASRPTSMTASKRPKQVIEGDPDNDRAIESLRCRFGRIVRSGLFRRRPKTAKAGIANDAVEVE